MWKISIFCKSHVSVRVTLKFWLHCRVEPMSANVFVEFWNRFSLGLVLKIAQDNQQSAGSSLKYNNWLCPLQRMTGSLITWWMFFGHPHGRYVSLHVLLSIISLYLVYSLGSDVLSFFPFSPFLLSISPFFFKWIHPFSTTPCTRTHIWHPHNIYPRYCTLFHIGACDDIHWWKLCYFW